METNPGHESTKMLLRIYSILPSCKRNQRLIVHEWCERIRTTKDSTLYPSHPLLFNDLHQNMTSNMIPEKEKSFFKMKTKIKRRKFASVLIRFYII